MSMNTALAEIFGTKTASSQHSEEDLEKQANYEFFGALCKEHNIDLTTLSDEQVNNLYKTAMDMKASGASEGDADKPEKNDPPVDKEAEAKVAAARQEYAEKRAAAVKIAEAEMMGRVMAHSMVDEMRKIAESMGGAPPFPPKKDDGDKKDEKKDDKKDEGKEKESSAARAEKLIAEFQAKTAGAATGSSTPHFDELASYRAIELLKTAGVSPEEAFNKVNAAYTLGLKESTKIASAQSESDALEQRALEICEFAGYQVNWQ